MSFFASYYEQWGRVFVDRETCPQTAMILSDNIYLAGNATNPEFNEALFRFVHASVFPMRRYEHLQFYPCEEDWTDLLLDLFRNDGIITIERTGFVFDAAVWKQRHADWRMRIPEGFEVRRIDAEIGARVGGPVDMFGSVDAFLRHGVGYVTLKGDEITGNCQSVFVGDGHAETALSTVEAYRRIGLATAATCAYIEECLSRGLIPDWQCYYNEPSERMAQKMGFVKTGVKPIPYVHVPN